MKRHLKALVIFVLLAILLGMPLLLTPHRIRPSTWDRITLGMTEQEVEALLGAKAGNYDGYLPRPFAPATKTWCSRYGTFSLWFDNRGRAIEKWIGPAEPGVWWAKMLHRLFPPAALDTERDEISVVF